MSELSELIVIRQRYTPYGGAERFISRMLGQLADEGLRVRILCREWEGEVPFEVTRLPVSSLTRAQRERSFARLACTHVHASPDALVQSHERLSCCDIYRAGDGVHKEWMAQRRRRRHGWRALLDRFSPFHRYVLQAERQMFASRRLQLVICNSEMVKREIIRHFNVAEDRLRVIHNGVDTERFHPALRERHRDNILREHGLDASRPLFLFVGSGYERKGLDNTLAALAQANPAIQLLVIGKDRRQGQYENRARELQIAERVRFLGPQKTVEQWYGAADALILPTLYDPFPNVIVEAMASGLAVITSTKSGATDIIEPGRNGLVCDAFDEAALAGHMDRLSDPAECRRIGDAARTTAEGLTLENMTRQYTGLYREILG